jgi:murein DD-endopeptidase MepM/ murein hydrolase activator NlpD
VTTLLVRSLFVLATLVSASEAAAQTRTSTRGPMWFSPAKPRIGDLVAIEVHNEDLSVEKGEATIFGHWVDLFRIDGWRLRGIAAVPLETKPGPHEVVARVGGSEVKVNVEVIDREFDASELTVSPRFTEKPSAALKARLKAEREEWLAMYQAEPGKPHFFGKIVRPVSKKETGNFGTRRIFNGQTKSRHYGLDLDGVTGDPIRAVAAGRVVLSDLRFTSGGTVVIDHGSGLYTAYFHMHTRKKKKGDWVESGEKIGLVGKTGRVTGPHLHLAVIVRMDGLTKRGAPIVRGLYVDPSPFLGLTFDGDQAYADAPPPKGKKATAIAQAPGKTRSSTSASGTRPPSPP